MAKSLNQLCNLAVQNMTTFVNRSILCQIAPNVIENFQSLRREGPKSPFCLPSLLPLRCIGSRWNPVIIKPKDPLYPLGYHLSLHFLYLISERERIFQYIPPSDNTPLQAKKSQKSYFWHSKYVDYLPGYTGFTAKSYLQFADCPFSTNFYPCSKAKRMNNQTNLIYILDL